MRVPESTKTSFKWRPGPAYAWYAGAVSVVEGKPSLSSILLFGDGAIDNLYMVYAQGKLSEGGNSMEPNDVLALKADVASAFGMQIETLGTTPPPVEPGETIQDFADYLQLSD